MKFHKALVVPAALAALLSVSACKSTDGNKETIGTLAGAGLGALVGSQVGQGQGRVVGGVIGALVGGFAGNRLGAMMDDRDRELAAEAREQALETENSVAWSNPESGHEGETRLVRQWDEDGTRCYEFEETILIGGETETGLRTVCPAEQATT